MAPEPQSQSAPETVVEFQEAEYRIADRPILKSLSLKVSRGETLVLLGRSGSGKTTALKLVNRLLDPSAGQVRVEERTTLEWDPIRLRRRIGYVIQESGLFPHFTVERNVALVPELEQWPKNRVTDRVRELLGVVGLDPAHFAQRYPHQLSGGQRQRVGVARALAADPPILLMDEPFGALDVLTRVEIQREFLDIQRRLQKTILFVTHDMREALLVGKRIALLEAGALTGVYSPQDFLRSTEPTAAAYVAAFRGDVAPRTLAKRGDQ